MAKETNKWQIKEQKKAEDAPTRFVGEVEKRH